MAQRTIRRAQDTKANPRRRRPVSKRADRVSSAGTPVADRCDDFVVGSGSVATPVVVAVGTVGTNGSTNGWERSLRREASAPGNSGSSKGDDRPVGRKSDTRLLLAQTLGPNSWPKLLAQTLGWSTSTPGVEGELQLEKGDDAGRFRRLGLPDRGEPFALLELIDTSSVRASSFMIVADRQMFKDRPMFEKRLAAAVLATEARLDRILDDRLALEDEKTPARLTAALRHAVLGGGKRFRPFLVLESARLMGVSEAAAIDAAAALECIHCYSLVHDDLPVMDNDDMRRGRPTVWKAYDEWTAILAGDALLTLAFEIIAASPAINSDAKVALVLDLARASGRAGMVGGQQLDLEADKLGTPAVTSLAHIRRLQAMKTGALIRFACTAGVYLAGRTAGDLAALGTYGEHLGFAFQISDDLLDVTGDAATVGKAVAKDAAAGKATLVSLMGVDAARDRLVEVEAAAIAALVPYGAAADTLRDAAYFVSRRTS
jgi:farnesyl diphosphate synthase